MVRAKTKAKQSSVLNNIPNQKLMLRTMLLIRKFEQKVLDLYSVNTIVGSIHAYIGEEAVAVGVSQNLNKDDYVFSSHRGHGHCLAKGADPKLLMAELCGKEEGYSKGRGGSMHVFSKELGIMGTNGIVGGGIPFALGAGMHIKLRHTDQVSVCYFGDGAMNEGVFFESLNLAATHKLPVIFIGENNLYATATRVNEVTVTEKFSPRGSGLGVPSATIDGNDLAEVYTHAAKAVQRARSGEGPTFLECATYRQCGHYAGENPRYRPDGELELWLKKDPIEQFSRTLFAESILDQSEFEQMEQEIDLQIEEAVKFCENASDPDPNEALNPASVYADQENP